MPVIVFGEWLPDIADYQNPGVLTAKNVLPAARGYKPFPAFGATTDALDARPRGAIQARDKDLLVYQFAGDAAKLYQNVASAWTDRSKMGGYATAAEERWEFLQWKNKVLATNYTDNPQQITLGGTVFSDLTTDFKARHITSIRDFVVFANTDDATDNEVPSRVRWSAFNDETDYTVSPSTLSDFQDLKIASVERIFGGEYGVILQTNNIWRQTFVGAPVVFQFDNVLPGVGVIAPGAAAQDGDIIYLLSNQGFLALLNGTQREQIGANKIDEFVLGDIDTDHLDRVSAAIDPKSHRVYWAYPGAGNVSGRPNKIIVYDRSINRWAFAEDEIELLWEAGGLGLTLEELDSISASLDALPLSLDSRAYIGGAAQLGAFDDIFKAGFFNGIPMAATIVSKELEIHSGHNTHLKAFRPLTNGGAVTAKIGTRDRQVDSAAFGSSLTLSSSGRFTKRSNARYHRLQFDLSGSWTKAVGFQIDPADAPRGERRA